MINIKKAEKKGTKLWIVVFLINAAVLYIALVIFPSLVVLGNASLSILASLIVTSLILTLILTQVNPLVKALKVKTKSDLFWSFVYTVANIVGLWLLSRGALYTGFGIASFVVAIELGIVLAILQYIAWKLLLGK